MRKYFRLLFISILVCLFYVYPAQAKDIAMDFKLQDLRQEIFSLSSYKNRQPVILFFWTTWCPFCIKELSTLKDIYPQLQKEGWELFAVNVGESASKVDNFLKNYALNFKVLLDKDMAVAYAYGILGVPTYFLVDKNGYIVFKEHYFPRERYKELIYK